MYFERVFPLMDRHVSSNVLCLSLNAYYDHGHGHGHGVFILATYPKGKWLVCDLWSNSPGWSKGMNSFIRIPSELNWIISVQAFNVQPCFRSSHHDGDRDRGHDPIQGHSRIHSSMSEPNHSSSQEVFRARISAGSCFTFMCSNKPICQSMHTPFKQCLYHSKSLYFAQDCFNFEFEHSNKTVCSNEFILSQKVVREFASVLYCLRYSANRRWIARRQASELSMQQNEGREFNVFFEAKTWKWVLRRDSLKYITFDNKTCVRMCCNKQDWWPIRASACAWIFETFTC
jgi:hypothetical protein